jgi:adenylyl- and sulfurtransferase ThiI
LEGTTILCWSGRGKLQALVSSVIGILRSSRMRAQVRTSGRTVLVSGHEPVAVAALMSNLPGVSWIAIGKSVNSTKGLGEAAADLASKYLRRGDRFSVLGDVGSPLLQSDLTGLVTSSVLEKVKGARTGEVPRVRFRVAFDGQGGAVGVQLIGGPGGVPTGTERAICFVSGGKHSSTVAWMAALSGYRISILHAAVSEQSLREAARLYAELSHRMDSANLSLEVLNGEGAIGALKERMNEDEGIALGGFHPGCSSAPRKAEALKAPLLLMQEEEVDSRFLVLGLNGDPGVEKWTGRDRGTVTRRRFGGVRVDVNGVLDGLR